MGYRLWGGVAFVIVFCATVHFIRLAIRAYQAPEFKRDLAALREQRRRRKAAKR